MKHPTNVSWDVICSINHTDFKRRFWDVILVQVMKLKTIILFFVSTHELSFQHGWSSHIISCYGMVITNHSLCFESYILLINILIA